MGRFLGGKLVYKEVKVEFFWLEEGKRFFYVLFFLGFLRIAFRYLGGWGEFFFGSRGLEFIFEMFYLKRGF